jgi:hypothetical protein
LHGGADKCALQDEQRFELHSAAMMFSTNSWNAHSVGGCVHHQSVWQRKAGYSPPFSRLRIQRRQ